MNNFIESLGTMLLIIIYLWACTFVINWLNSYWHIINFEVTTLQLFGLRLCIFGLVGNFHPTRVQVTNPITFK